MFDYQPATTVYSRVDRITGVDGMVGYPYNALKEAYCSGHAERMLLLQDETLVNQPRKALDVVYELIGEPRARHDFERIEFDASDYDRRAGTPGQHTMRPRNERGGRTARNQSSCRGTCSKASKTIRSGEMPRSIREVCASSEASRIKPDGWSVTAGNYLRCHTRSGG